MKITLTKAQLLKMNPCDVDARLEMFGSKRQMDARQALAAGFSITNLCWVAGRHSDESLRRVVGFAIDCAQRVASRNPDPRVQAAIDAAKACFACPTDATRSASNAAARAASDAAADAGRVTARAASDAAADAVRATARVATWAADAAMTGRSAWWRRRAAEAADMAADVARAAVNAVSALDTAAWAAESSWQADRFIYWMTEESPVLLPA